VEATAKNIDHTARTAREMAEAQRDSFEALAENFASAQRRSIGLANEGLEAAMRLGLADERKLADEVVSAVCEPFAGDASRRALADAGIGLEPEGFSRIAERLPSLRMPVRVVYGEQDRILPDIAATATRLRQDVPQAEVTALPGCGHFLQEEAPEEVGELLASFFERA
jgi:pimeloyl-ACP methyl ester carboxylesterase